MQVSEGTLGPGTHCIEFERSAVVHCEVEHNLGPYWRMAAAGRPVPLLVVCETARGRTNFRDAAGTLPILTATLERARRSGDGRGDGVEQERSTGSTALPTLTTLVLRQTRA